MNPILIGTSVLLLSAGVPAAQTTTHKVEVPEVTRDLRVQLTGTFVSDLQISRDRLVVIGIVYYNNKSARVSVGVRESPTAREFTLATPWIDILSEVKDDKPGGTALVTLETRVKGQFKDVLVSRKGSPEETDRPGQPTGPLTSVRARASDPCPETARPRSATSGPCGLRSGGRTWD